MSLKSQWLCAVLSNKKLTNNQKVILTVIYQSMNSRLFCYPSREFINKLCGAKLSNITIATTKAEKLGLLKKGRRRSENNQYTMRTYTGIINKSKSTESPHTVLSTESPFSFLSTESPLSVS